MTKHTIKRFLAVTAAALCLATANAVNPAQIRFHNERTDTTAITEMLKKVEAMHTETPRKAVTTFAEMLVGKPYKAGTLEGDPEMHHIHGNSNGTCHDGGPAPHIVAGFRL